MWGYLGRGYLSFTSRGVELDQRPDPEDFMHPEPKPGAKDCDAPPADDGDIGKDAAVD
jgi:hypothetical protein